MKKKMRLLLWGVLSVAVLIITIMHPRLNNALLFILCIIKCVVIVLKKKKTENREVLKKDFGLIIVFVILWYVGVGEFLNILYPYHATYEYRSDIANYKTRSTKEYYQEFPDDIPDEAKGIKWICWPSFMQGSGYDVLFFYADSYYLKQLYERYSNFAVKYSYSNYGWENSETGKAVTFPRIKDMTETEKTHVIVFIIYDNGDTNHPHNSGIYINQLDGYVCYFAQ